MASFCCSCGRSFHTQSPRLPLLRHRRSVPQPSRLNSFISRRSHQLSNFSQTKDGIQGLKTSLKLMSVFKKPVFDIPFLVRLSEWLNIEFPKTKTGKYQQVLGSAIKLRLSKLPTSPESESSTSQVDTPAGDENSIEATKKRVQAKLDKNWEFIQKEEHDFGESMMKTQESLDASATPTTIHFPTRKSLKRSGDGQESQTSPAAATQLPQKPADGKSKHETDIKTNSADSSKSVVQQLTSNLRLPAIWGGSSEKPEKPTESRSKAIFPTTPVKRQLIAKGSVDKVTRGLVLGLKAATTNISKLHRLEELCKHLAEYPDSKHVAIKTKLVPHLLRLRVCKDRPLSEISREALALVGYIDPVRGRGIRILTLDGGGTKGLMTIEMLKKIEESCQKEIHEVFDYICGVSTGSLIAAMVSAFRVPLDEAEEIYKEFSDEMFRRNRLKGAGRLITEHAYYDSELWEKILQENVGLKSFLETTRDPKCPKLSGVSVLVNAPILQPFLFRNYTLPPGVQSHYPGSMQYKLWEAIRASSAAPGYYGEKKLDDWIHGDGGILANNPTAIAIHESKLLWPNDRLQCVVSLGTGRYEPTDERKPTSFTSLKQKLSKVIQSATDTEGVHTVLQDLLPPSTYFRFNPYMSEDYPLDEISPQKWDQMKHDTLMYSRKNEHKLQKAAQQLIQPKAHHQRLRDWAKLRLDTIT